MVEVDGSTHVESREADELRNACLEHFGLQVLRFTNDQVLSTIDEVLTRIQVVARARYSGPHRDPDSAPLSRIGGVDLGPPPRVRGGAGGGVS
ncbi:MAG: DUF559 domain-containing protein [Woeseiaceae bacterium]